MMVSGGQVVSELCEPILGWLMPHANLLQTPSWRQSAQPLLPSGNHPSLLTIVNKAEQSPACHSLSSTEDAVQAGA